MLHVIYFYVFFQKVINFNTEYKTIQGRLVEKRDIWRFLREISIQSKKGEEKRQLKILIQAEFST